ncbi:MAG TPA: threonine synthase [Firmicutes bacterium]|nr:threonine synthase [Bacillota bacterium]
MLYISSRNPDLGVTPAEAIKLGIAPDGGLFTPERVPRLGTGGTCSLDDMIGMTYPERAKNILRAFLTDFTDDELAACIDAAYGRGAFDTRDIAPVRPLEGSPLYILELWHGPTCAFKDIALQILPHLLALASRKTSEEREIVILVATSGDTGKAALEGFKDVPGTRIIVFYPLGGVSEVQERQMVTQEGQNVAAVGILGNFDEAQSGVKRIFGDAEFNAFLSDRGFRLSSANSINWGRLVPQIVYYISAYCDLVAMGELAPGEEVNIAVPTGNFGNILAAYYAKRMGLPVHRLICASNENNVLVDFIRTGIYNRNRKFVRTISPSMDILVSSNLERLLFELTGHNGELIRQWMRDLAGAGTYEVDGGVKNALSELFWSDYATEEETLSTIRAVYDAHRYIMDTHTAVGKNVYDKYMAATRDRRKAILASTASPFKFAGSVVEAIAGEESIRGRSDFDLLRALADIGNMPIPKGLRDLESKPPRHMLRCTPANMHDVVMQLLF